MSRPWPATQGGFLLVDRHGEFVAWAASAEVALKRHRTVLDDGAVGVVRASDGAWLTRPNVKRGLFVVRSAVLKEARAVTPRAPKPVRTPRPPKVHVAKVPRVPRVPRVRRNTLGRPKLDITGMRFGRLVAVSDASGGEGYTRGIQRSWLCQCDCGATCTPMQKSLRSGATVSCGCKRRDNARAMGEARK